MSYTSHILIILSLLLCRGTFGKEETFAFFGFQLPKQQLQFATLDQNGKKKLDFLLDPNPKRNLTLSLHHKKVSLFVGFPILKEDIGETGKSKAFDLRFKGQFKEFLPFLYFQKYSGFSLKDEGNDSTTITFFNQVKTRHFGGGLMYYFKDDFISYHSGQKFFDRLKKSDSNKPILSSSYLLSAGYDDLVVMGLPGETIDQSFSDFNGRSEFQTLHIEGGGTIQYTRNKYKLEGSLLLGPGFTRYQNIGGAQENNVSLYANVDLIFVANIFENYFLTFSGNFQSITGNVRGANFANNMNGVELSLGRAF